MNAIEAREIAEANLKEPVIGPYLEIIHSKISEAAKAGRFSIIHPLEGLWPTVKEKEAVWAALAKEGYKVSHHPDPDPGHPASRPFTEVLW